MGLILVAGVDKAYNRWDTLEDTMENRKKVDQVWNAFENSFEQSTSFGISETPIWQNSDKMNRRQ